MTALEFQIIGKLYVKKTFRSNTSRLFLGMYQEFDYLPESFCLQAAKIITMCEILVQFVTPILIIFVPVYCQYGFLLTCMAVYLVKSKKWWAGARGYIHSLFINNTLFEIYYVTIVGFSLLLNLEFFVIPILAVMLIIGRNKGRLISVASYLYVFFYILAVLFFDFYLNNLTGFFSVTCVVFLILISTLILVGNYINKMKSYGKILILKLKIFIRSVTVKNLYLVETVFPIYIFIFLAGCFVLTILSQNTILEIGNLSQNTAFLLLFYYGAYFIYIKTTMLKYDENVFFYLNKEEIGKLHPCKCFLNSLFTMVLTNSFNILWGVFVVMFF